MNKSSLVVGISITVSWFLIIGLFCIQNNFGFSNKDLNSLGDFLAGVFAPVAFLWLILGYVQQGEALRKQSDALEFQIKEFKNLVDLESQKRIDKLKSSKPKLKVENLKCTFEKLADGQIKYARFVGSLVNKGVGDAIEIQLRPISEGLLKVNPQIIGEKIVVNASDRVAFNIGIKQESYYEMSFVIEYKDLYENQYNQKIHFNLLQSQNESFSVLVKTEGLFVEIIDNTFDQFPR